MWEKVIFIIHVKGILLFLRYFVHYYLTVEGQQIACLAFNLRICEDDRCL